jgi:flavin-dependent dehydrogenase
LAEFRADPEAALLSFVAGVPDAPPIRDSQRVSPVIGKIEMPNQVRVPVAPGLALVGDAALAVDPLFGVGCGWALQSAEWLAESVTPALRGAEPLQSGLDRYRRRHRRELRGHAFFVNDYATGRPLNPVERVMFAGAARDAEVAARFDALATRCTRPGRAIAGILPRAIAANARHALNRPRRARAVSDDRGAATSGSSGRPGSSGSLSARRSRSPSP